MSDIAFPKINPARDKKYRAWVRTKPCILHSAYYNPVVAHHISAGGMGTKCSDYETVPLCHSHHLEIHDHGKDTFERKYSIDLKEEAERLKEEWDVRA